MKITIRVYQNGKDLVAKVFDEGVFRIGRSEFSDIVLDDDHVSRSHLEIRVTENAVYMTNMSSGGKVRVNGKARETAELANGDELILGPFKILIFHEAQDINPEPAAVEAPPLDLGGEPGAGGFGGGGFGEPGGEPAPDAGGVALQDPPQEAVANDLLPEAPIEAARDEAPVDGTSGLGRAETQIEIKPIVAKLIFTEGPRNGDEIRLESYEVTMGRSKRADVFIDDEKLSRVHAKITRVGNGYRLIDLNSRNGTYVNGVRVLEHPLSSFDVVELGNTKLKFLIHDLMAANDFGVGGALAPVGPTGTEPAIQIEQTKSLQVDALPPEVLFELQRPPSPNFGAPPPPVFGGGISVPAPEPTFGQNRAKRNRIIMGAIAALLLIVILMPGGENQKKEDPKVAQTQTQKEKPDIKLPPSIPKEYADLSPEMQRTVEGLYNSAQTSGDEGAFDQAVAELRRIHEVLPYYKQSRELQEQYGKKLKEKQIADAQEKAKKDEKQDLQIYLDEGMEYLKEGDFARAAESFNSAIVIDPNNEIASKGLKAAEAKVKSLDEIPPEKDPEADKRKLVAELFQKAVTAFQNKSYQEAIDTADKIRAVELKGDTQYLNEAKQIIDRARSLQKEEFEPFLIQAKEKYAEGDYNASRDLCEEMLKRDSAYEEAKECVFKAKKQLNRLAKEAYTHGYILESMNRIEEAKQYWNRAKNYVREGDDYFEKVNKKLEYYQ